jgi:hypothetical protein
LKLNTECPLNHYGYVRRRSHLPARGTSTPRPRMLPYCEEYFDMVYLSLIIDMLLHRPLLRLDTFNPGPSSKCLQNVEYISAGYTGRSSATIWSACNNDTPCKYPSHKKAHSGISRLKLDILQNVLIVHCCLLFTKVRGPWFLHARSREWLGSMCGQRTCQQPRPRTTYLI